MEHKRAISILYPEGVRVQTRSLSDTACHDIGLDSLCEELTKNNKERGIIMSVLRTMTDSPETAAYRIGVFTDICAFPDMRERMLMLLDQIQFLNDYGSFKREHDIKSGLWEFMHRLSELNDYINTVEAIMECLSSCEIRSEGLQALKAYIQEIYEDSLFDQLKADIAELNADTDSLKSVTIGVNLKKSFEVDSIGLISVNNKEFKSSGILGNFADALSSKQGIRDGNGWNGSYRFHPIQRTTMDIAAESDLLGKFTVAMSNPLMAASMGASTVASVPEKDSSAYMTHYFDKEVSQLLSHLVKKLEKILSRYVSFSITSIVDLIPEFIYYVRSVEYMERLKDKGFTFCTPEALSDYADDQAQMSRMQARGLYNLKLAASGVVSPAEIVANDLDFDSEHTCYILTGANRGGKTTITQAVGLLYVLAQGGICVPAESFAFQPVDCIYTHYPADEDKTLDLGRLGEECRRFKELYSSCTEHSLLLLNETFSTTSFEEGYYIARDAVKAILYKNVRTIYNTHMHKLAFEVDAMNQEMKDDKGKAASLVAHAEGGNRSFHITVSAPEGKSYAEDIAVKYGVTYDMLKENEDGLSISRYGNI